MDKTLILNEIKTHIGVSSNAAFARFLDIKPNVVTNWYARNTFNAELINTKCVDISAEWLMTGEGEMLISDNPADVCNDSNCNYHTLKSIPYWDLPVSAGQSIDDIIGQKVPDGFIKGLPGAEMAEHILPVIGVSMVPEINPGAIIGVRKINNWETLNTERIYLIITQDDRMIKRIEHDQEHEIRKTHGKMETYDKLMHITGHSTVVALEKYLRDIDAELPGDYSDLFD